jgi:DNA-binding MarR family transcriptional regulator
MHAVSFGFKRAHWSAVRIGKRALARVEGMTPARFDLLYLIRRVRLEDPLLHPVAAVKRQEALWKELGVHPTTVSRMLAQLLEMGWVERERCVVDRRCWVLRLTALGWRRVTRAMRILFRQRVVLKVYERLFPTGPSGHVVERIDALVKTLRRVAYALGDRGRVWFDYGHPPANLRLVQLTEPRFLRWIRMARERAQEERAVAAARSEGRACLGASVDVATAGGRAVELER